jgi:threonine-phosphate decarboxylase
MSVPSPHGGRVREAAQRFGLAPEAMLDFSSNMNVLAPPIPAGEWAHWQSEIERYPEDKFLASQLAEVYETEPSWLLPTAGAIEAIYLAARLFAGKCVAVFEPGFGEYLRAFRAAEAHVEQRVLNGLLNDDLSGFDAIILGNPNNPTGSLFSTQQLLDLNARALLVDEAFIEFAGRESLLPMLSANPRMILFRSLTKSWRIPGLRLGFLATANREWLARLSAMQPPWSINSITAAWARKYLNRHHYRHVQASLEKLPQLRENFLAELSRIPGIKPHPSSANFFLIELLSSLLDASELSDRLARRGFLVRVCDSFHGIARGKFLRVAVRTEEENALFAAALRQVIHDIEIGEKSAREKLAAFEQRAIAARVCDG